MPVRIESKNSSFTYADAVANLDAASAQAPDKIEHCRHGLPKRLLGQPVVCEECKDFAPPTLAQQIEEGFSAVATDWRVNVRRAHPDAWLEAYILKAKNGTYQYQHAVRVDLMASMVLTPRQLGEEIGRQCLEQYHQVLARSRSGTKARQTHPDP